MFTQRSNEKELIDLGPNYYSHEEYQQCMQKMFRVNQLLGIFHSTVRFLKNFPKANSLLDIGCGNGLFLLNLSKYFPAMKFQGSDIGAEAIHLAQQSLKIFAKENPRISISFKLQEQKQILLPENSVDIILATLVCHHLDDEELIEFLREAYLSARTVIIIHDLHRHFLAYWVYGLISPILFRNRLLTHDGLISIKRGFTRKEWINLLKKAGIQNYRINWGFPFRWKVILWKES